ncbi:MAG TPA: YhdH/YhfP family quinone oxidoreductase, partial [Burkholderiales bacterium]|nr:YhdH/YhfP family quinone oxidoreductase [Burkholderiales bacterium]
NIDDLPENDTLIKVLYSSLNYKDALSASGNRGITRRYPHTPGMDAAGIVVKGPDFREGEEVLAMGFDLGMNTPGGFGQYVRVPSSWVSRKPEGLTLKECMIYGTAGYTAGLSLMRLAENGVNPDSGEILVTGATGGVGMLAIGMLAKIGYRVVASTGKREAQEFLKSIGASEVISREALHDPGKPLSKGRWAGVVDTVGGEILVSALKSTKYGGIVTCCGMVAGTEFCSSIFPFILRGVALCGIDAAQSPMGVRKGIWKKLSREWRPENLDGFHIPCALEELEGRIESMLAGQSMGRVVVSLWTQS